MGAHQLAQGFAEDIQFACLRGAAGEVRRGQPTPAQITGNEVVVVAIRPEGWEIDVVPVAVIVRVDDPRRARLLDPDTGCTCNRCAASRVRT